MSGQSLYEILGVLPSAPNETIKKVYRELAKRYHPDAHQGRPEYEELLKEITAAYAVLGNQLKRAAYDLRLASGAAESQSEPEDLWEPSPEELRNIYALDEEERYKEIERLCKLHPHLETFFEDRPPPPRFKPSGAYVSEFRQRERAWRLSEIERQCARHPHLRQWFADLEAQCEHAEEEQARLRVRERERAAQYENERAVLAGVAFASLGGAGALFVAFVPVWIIAGIIGVFAGGWSSNVETNQAAFRSEANWFWLLWIGCGLTGAGLFFAAQVQERWLESKSRDITWTRVKGLLIAGPCIIAIVTMISLRAEEMSRTAGRLDALVQKKQSGGIVVVEAKPLRIRAVTVDDRSLNANAFAQPGRAIANRFPLFAIEYDGEHPGDRISISLTRANSEATRAGESRGHCQSDRLPPYGQWKCQWKSSLEPGYYVFDVLVNCQYRNAYYFALVEARQ